VSHLYVLAWLAAAFVVGWVIDKYYLDRIRKFWNEEGE